jgi:hypothetical protein
MIRVGSIIVERTPADNVRIETAHMGGLIRPDDRTLSPMLCVVVERADIDDLIAALVALRSTP